MKEKVRRNTAASLPSNRRAAPQGLLPYLLDCLKCLKTMQQTIMDKTIKSIEKAVFLGMNSFSWKVLQSQTGNCFSSRTVFCPPNSITGLAFLHHMKNCISSHQNTKGNIPRTQHLSVLCLQKISCERDISYMLFFSFITRTYRKDKNEVMPTLFSAFIPQEDHQFKLIPDTAASRFPESRSNCQKRWKEPWVTIIIPAHPKTVVLGKDPARQGPTAFGEQHSWAGNIQRELQSESALNKENFTTCASSSAGACLGLSHVSTDRNRRQKTEDDRTHTLPTIQKSFL